MTTTSTSFLTDCPQCGLMIPKGGPCAECHWSENAGAAQYSEEDVVQAFAARHQLHLRNYAIIMVLMFTTGLVSLITAAMWIMVIYLGDILAFLLIGVLTVASGILAVTTACAKKMFPVDLNCPACEIRLDELGTDGDHCPNCSARLK
jgi:hypothetical protein